MHTDRQTDRQTDRLTDRQTDSQTDRLTHRQTDRHFICFWWPPTDVGGKRLRAQGCEVSLYAFTGF